ncbi:MAG: hypothetical protein H7840_00375 [Alphaproteobacteria bacterium]
MWRSLSAAAVLLALAAPAAAAAGDQTPPDRCRAVRDGCADACTQRHPEGDAARVGCIARCTADHAACEAQSQYDAAKPWLNDQVGKMRRFYEGFKGDGPPGAPPGAPPPDPRTPPARPADPPGGKPI